jgi:aromatic ring hydroxylase
MIFQIMAPPRADRMRRLFTTAGLIIPVPTVLATWTPTKKTAANSKNAAQMTAFLGERTLVDTMVEMALAESWKPLRKSKTRATAMRKTTKANESGIMIPDEAVRHVSKRCLPQC